MKQRRATPRRRDPEHFVDEAYREHVRKQPCCAPIEIDVQGCTEGPCRRPSEAHHHTGKRGLGQKTSDRFMMPLCLQHHGDFHAARGVFKGWSRYERSTWQDEHAETAWMGYAGKPKDERDTF